MLLSYLKSALKSVHFLLVNGRTVSLARAAKSLRNVVQVAVDTFTKLRLRMSSCFLPSRSCIFFEYFTWASLVEASSMWKKNVMNCIKCSAGSLTTRLPNEFNVRLPSRMFRNAEAHLQLIVCGRLQFVCGHQSSSSYVCFASRRLPECLRIHK